MRYAVSDGSVRHERGTFGWVKGNFTQTLETNSGIVEGPPGLITSYRTEAQGLTDMIYTGGIDNNTKVYLDNISVIGKVTQEHRLHSLHPEWDLLEPIQKEVRKSNLKITHVKGIKT